MRMENRAGRRDHVDVRPRRSRRRLVKVSALLVVLFLLGLWFYRAETMTVALEVSPLDMQVEAPNPTALAWPTYGQAAIATEQYGVIETHGAQTSHPTASTAKIITMLAVLEKKPLARGESGPTLTMTQADVDRRAWYVAHNGSNTSVYVGLQLTQYQAIQSVLLASSNNMADTLAIWAFGSIEAYHEYATTMLERWGIEQTVVGGDASGLSPATTSTAADLVRIALRALEHPVLAEIVAQSQADIPGAGTIHNTNRLLVHDEIVGMKTGETVEAGGNFILAGSQAQGDAVQQIVVVVMGATLSSVAMQDSYGLFQSARNNFTYQEIIAEGAPVARVVLPWQDNAVDVVASRSVYGWVWAGHPPSIVYLSPVSLVTNTHDTALPPLGSLLVTSGTDGAGSTETVDIHASTPVSSAPLWWRLWRAVSL